MILPIFRGKIKKMFHYKYKFIIILSVSIYLVVLHFNAYLDRQRRVVPGFGPYPLVQPFCNPVSNDNKCSVGHWRLDMWIIGPILTWGQMETVQQVDSGPWRLGHPAAEGWTLDTSTVLEKEQKLSKAKIKLILYIFNQNFYFRHALNI